MKTNDLTKPIYLDYNASTPLDPEVIEATMPFLTEYYGNPSSAHWYGIQTRNAVEKAREQVASSLNCSPEEIVFTSGGSESNNFAIKGIAFARREVGNHIVTSQIEHPAVIEVCKYLEKQGFDVTYLPVDEFGLVNPAQLEGAFTSKTILITIMHANNEVGTIQPIEEISRLASENDIIIHTDAAQSVAKIPTDINQLGVDFLSIAGHKLYAPQGVGVLYIRSGLQLPKLIHGGGHEGGKRAGTENVLEIVGLGKACEIGKRDLDKNYSHMMAMRDRLHQNLIRNKRQVNLNGHPEKRLPNTLNLSFKEVNSDKLISQISDKVAVSAGSACHSGKFEISDVLKAMNIPIERAAGAIRFSVGRMTTTREIDIATDLINNKIAGIEDSELNRAETEK